MAKDEGAGFIFEWSSLDLMVKHERIEHPLLIVARVFELFDALQDSAGGYSGRFGIVRAFCALVEAGKYDDAGGLLESLEVQVKGVVVWPLDGQG